MTERARPLGMKTPFNRLFPLLLVLALALLSLWLERAVQDPKANPSLLRHDPDYIVDRFSLVIYGVDGRPESLLTADKMLHYPDDDSSELLSPRVQQSRPGRPVLRLAARRGVLGKDGEEVFLYDDVELSRDAGPAGGETRLRTSFLHFVREGPVVRTDRPVLITQPGRSLSGIGMEYDGELHRFTLQRQVRGSFMPGNNRS